MDEHKKETEDSFREPALQEMSGPALSAAMHMGSGFASPFMKDICLKRQRIVGVRYQGGSDELVEGLPPGSRVTFIREPDNRFDPGAVMALDEQGRKIGYLPRIENDIPGALLEAGKSLYGIVSEKQEQPPNGTRTPYQLWVDLYMREFAPPGESAEPPRQGCRGSYAVIDVVPSAFENQFYVHSIFAIRVINGEEWGTFFQYLDDTYDEDRCREMVEAFRKFAGLLPLVGHGIAGLQGQVLAEAYGLLLGRPFSNRVIDTLRMAGVHLPGMRAFPISRLTKLLGLEEKGDSAAEIRCRQTWELYRRMDLSELWPGGM
ncbi:MAG: hypothetical protein IJX90_09555 [Blautia sp.]|nr:hypothetical protein [Blautia sp.]